MLIRVFQALLVVLVLSGCGQKGPLVLPPPEGVEVQQLPNKDKPKT